MFFANEVGQFWINAMQAESEYKSLKIKKTCNIYETLKSIDNFPVAPKVGFYALYNTSPKI